MNFTFFSQYQQDKVIYQRFFQGVQNGVFIEIGADDGIDKSNTLFLKESLAGQDSVSNQDPMLLTN